MEAAFRQWPLEIQPDPEISAAWAAEAEDRLTAYRRGELEVVDEGEVFGDLDHP